MRKILRYSWLLLLLVPLTGNCKPVHYSFTSNWEIRAPLERVWEQIDQGEDWYTWWNSLVGSKVLFQGQGDGIGKVMRYTWKSFLPFTLSINFTITKREMYKRIEGKSDGDLVGTGVWTFEERNGITYVQYKWDVKSTKRIMNLLSPVFKKFFVYNHNFIMHKGAKGLAKRLDAELIAG
jgi:hypothetical protein